jgi:dynein heavy chain
VRHRRTLLKLCQDFYCEAILKPSYKITPGYVMPPASNLTEYFDAIAGHPISDRPELFGLHAKADVNLKQLTSFTVLSDILSTCSSGAAANSALVQTVNGFLRNVPPPLDLKVIQEKFPSVYKESVNIVLQQEAVRYNDLLKLVKSSLTSLPKAMKGLIVFTNELNQNTVPPNLAAISHSSMKPLNRGWPTSTSG